MSYIVVRNYNRVCQFKQMLTDIKTKIGYNDELKCGFLYCHGRLEVSVFRDYFQTNKSQYTTKSFHFARVKIGEEEDLKQAFDEVFGKDIDVSIIGDEIKAKKQNNL